MNQQKETKKSDTLFDYLSSNKPNIAEYIKKQTEQAEQEKKDEKTKEFCHFSKFFSSLEINSSNSCSLKQDTKHKKKLLIAKLFFDCVLNTPNEHLEEILEMLTNDVNLHEEDLQQLALFWLFECLDLLALCSIPFENLCTFLYSSCLLQTKEQIHKLFQYCCSQSQISKVSLISFPVLVFLKSFPQESVYQEWLAFSENLETLSKVYFIDLFLFLFLILFLILFLFFIFFLF